MSMLPKSILSLGLVIAVSTPAFCQQTDPNGVRTIQWDPTVPLISRLLKDDRVVIVQKSMFPPGRAEQTSNFSEEVANLASADWIVVGEILTLGGSLVDGGSWIRGNAEVRVQNAIKSPKAVNATSGERLLFSHLNGQTTVKGIEIRAGEYPAFHKGSRYLLFLGRGENGALHLSVGYSIQPDQTLNWIQMFPNGVEPAASTLLGKQLAIVTEALVSAVRRQP